MKTCPKCNTQYTDDTLSFCLNDGTPLTGAATDSPTVVLNDSETVVRGSGADWQQSQATHYIPQQQIPPQQPPTSGGRSPMLIVAIAALVLLAVVGVAAVGGFIYFNSSGSNTAVTNANNSATPSRTPETNKAANVTATPSPTPKMSSPTPSASATPGSLTSIDKAPTNFTSKRFEFPKGAFSSNISDSLDVGEQRTYLVACRAGQTMNTKVERGLPCITYSNGGSALRWTTFSGDNKVTIKNNCEQRSGFVVSVSVM